MALSSEQTTLRARHVLSAGRDLGAAEVTLDADGRIREVVATALASEFDVLAPGFIDMQVNGIGRVDVAQAEGADWDELDELLLSQGTTSWCPTLVSAPLDSYEVALARIAAAAARPPGARPRPRPRPTILGVHLEGPFISVPGAHRPDRLRDPDLDWLLALPDIVRVVTLAPERRDGLDAVRLLAGRGVTVSVGHSAADTETMLAAVDAGATMVTHLFNAMPPMHHRNPGPVGCALADERLTVTVIADNIHVDPLVLRAAAAACAGRLALVTDAAAFDAGHSGELRVATADDAPRLADGTLAGSRLRMDEAVRNLVAAGVPLAAGVAAATSVPARALGITDRGALATGMRGDLVALSSSGDVEAVWVGGELVRR